NWAYWLIIDSAAIVLYWQTGYYATVILFVVYTVLAVVGFVSWIKLYRQQQV
ncbi:MAG: nicotinamide mononucleotide transporter, partial [Proteobacteria bacterium]|nr:nicotinamide mononucleotide transporter [Pseudomonadota bacterium]